MTTRQLFRYFHHAFSAINEALLRTRMFFYTRRSSTWLTTFNFSMGAPLMTFQVANMATIEFHLAQIWANNG